MGKEAMTTADGNVQVSAAAAERSSINHADPQDADLVQVLLDRLRGNGAWNGNGLLIFLASTSRRDKERLWMEPLKDLCEKVVYPVEDGEAMPKLDKDERAQVEELLAYSARFHAALAADKE